MHGNGSAAAEDAPVGGEIGQDFVAQILRIAGGRFPPCRRPTGSTLLILEGAFGVFESIACDGFGSRCRHADTRNREWQQYRNASANFSQ
jgi:hypothetical protein